jgi:hypothetical protein
MLLILASVVFLGSESLGNRDHILLSQFETSFSSPPTTRRVTVEVFDAASTWVSSLCGFLYSLPVTMENVYCLSVVVETPLVLNWSVRIYLRSNVP